MFKATAEIIEAFEKADIKYELIERDGLNAVIASFHGNTYAALRAQFITNDDENDVGIRIFGIVRVPEGKRLAVLEAINELHVKYRYLRFWIDAQGDVTAGIDLLQCTPNAGDACVESMTRIGQIMNDAYPMLMKALWS